MYIYEFIRAIDLLKKEHTPEYLTLEEKALVYDCLDRKNAEKYISLPEKGEHFLLYDIGLELNCKDVTPYVEYMDRLKAENIPVPQNDPENKLFKAKLVEALSLFDKISSGPLEGEIFALYENLSAVFVIYGIDDTPVLDIFENIFNMKLFKAQFKFFISKYLEISLKEVSTEQKPIEYADSLITDILKERTDFSVRDISEITGIKNPEFDNILIQLG